MKLLSLFIFLFTFSLFSCEQAYLEIPEKWLTNFGSVTQLTNDNESERYMASLHGIYYWIEGIYYKASGHIITYVFDNSGTMYEVPIYFFDRLKIKYTIDRAKYKAAEGAS